MRVIITGGTGLIGRKLAASLADDYHEVIVLSRHPEHTHDLPPRVRVVGWDARTEQGWGHLADGADAIVNLAGESIAGTRLIPSRWTESCKQRIIQSRVNAAEAVVQAVRSAATRPHVVIQASAVGYYGLSGDKVIPESHQPGDDFLAHVCVQWENASAPLDDLGVRRAVIRIGLVLSGEGGVLPKLMLPFHLFVGGTLGTGRQWYPWIHIDDVIKAIRFLIARQDASGSYNLTASNPLTNRDFSRVLGRVMNRPALIPVPPFAFQLTLGEMATIILDGQRAIPQKLTEMGFDFQFPEADAALRNLLRAGNPALPQRTEMTPARIRGQRQ